MFAFECQNLVVGLGSLSSVIKSVFVDTAGIVLKILDCFLHSADALLCKQDLMAHAVDTHSKTLVFALDVVQKHFFML